MNVQPCMEIDSRRVLILGIKTKLYMVPPRMTGCCETRPMPDHGCCASGDCPAAAVLRALGSELKLVTMHSLMAQGRRFNELRELTGICQSSLARTVRELEELGVVARVVRTEERPVGVEYRLTPMGEDLGVAIEAIERWTERWLNDLRARVDLELA